MSARRAHEQIDRRQRQRDCEMGDKLWMMRRWRERAEEDALRTVRGRMRRAASRISRRRYR